MTAYLLVESDDEAREAEADGYVPLRSTAEVDRVVLEATAAGTGIRVYSGTAAPWWVSEQIFEGIGHELAGRPKVNPRVRSGITGMVLNAVEPLYDQDTGARAARVVGVVAADGFEALDVPACIREFGERAAVAFALSLGHFSNGEFVEDPGTDRGLNSVMRHIDARRGAARPESKGRPRRQAAAAT